MNHLKLPDVPGIVSTPDTCFGRTRFEHTRIPVWSVISCMAAGDSELDVMRAYNLSRAQMQAMYDLCYRFLERLP